jgi:hypothetical protein
MNLLVDRDVNNTACCGDSLVSAITDLWVVSGSPTPQALLTPRRGATRGVCPEENNVIHNARLRAGTEDTWDITYMPRDGQLVGSSVVQSQVVVRGTSGRSERVEVFFDGVRQFAEVPADGRSVAVTVGGAGLVSIVGNALIVEGREIWVTA